MDRLAFRIGYASTRLNELARAAREVADGFADDEDEQPDRRAPREGKRDLKRPHRGRRPSSAPDPEPLAGGAEMAAQAAVAALASRVISPRPVNWPRAVVAGTLGALVSEVIDRVELRPSHRKFGTSIGLRPDQDENGIPPWLMRCVTGVALASLYARYAYGRLPGTPLTQGIAFGALEAATARSGGATSLLGHLGSELPFPFDQLGPNRDDSSPERAVARHLAFGAVLGVVYR